MLVLVIVGAVSSSGSGFSTEFSLPDVESAKALCRDCPLRLECLAGAQERREPWGVWGGELFIQGVVVARKRPRGRPRKHPLPEPVAA